MMDAPQEFNPTFADAGPVGNDFTFDDPNSAQSTDGFSAGDEKLKKPGLLAPPAGDLAFADDFVHQGKKAVPPKAQDFVADFDAFAAPASSSPPIESSTATAVSEASGEQADLAFGGGSKKSNIDDIFAAKKPRPVVLPLAPQEEDIPMVSHYPSSRRRDDEDSSSDEEE